MIEIRTLGRTSVSVEGEPLSGEAVWPKSLALIVYMAREPGPDRREEILGVLWPERDEKRARRALNQLLYTLRKASPQLDLESIEDAVDFGREVWLDVEEFERRLETGDLKGAVEMYAGPFLVDLAIGEPEFDHWADRQRAGLGRKFRKAALQLATEAKASGEHDAAVVYCRRLNEQDSLDDEVQHLLIECLYLQGDRLAALRQYEEYRDLLERELEVEPLEHTRELVARIRAEPVPGVPVSEPELDAGEEEEGAAPALEARGEEVRSLAWLDRRWLLGAGALVVAMLVVVLWPRGAPPAGEPGVTASAALTDGGMRVAVLPFEHHGRAGEEEGLSEGIAQLLALGLAEGSLLETVDHRSVVRAFEGENASRATHLDPAALRELGGELGATAFVIGDVHHSGAVIRIVAELVDARTGNNLARADVRGPRDSLFELLDQLSSALAEGVDEPRDPAR